MSRKRDSYQVSCRLTCQLFPLVSLMFLALFLSKGSIKLQVGREFSKISSNLSGIIKIFYSASKAVFQAWHFRGSHCLPKYQIWKPECYLTILGNNWWLICPARKVKICPKFFKLWTPHFYMFPVKPRIWASSPQHQIVPNCIFQELYTLLLLSKFLYSHWSTQLLI